jgi:hypothetical protein
MRSSGPSKSCRAKCLYPLLQLAQQLKGACDPESLTREVQQAFEICCGLPGELELGHYAPRIDSQLGQRVHPRIPGGDVGLVVEVEDYRNGMWVPVEAVV